ncbi:MAG TPA: hypothetical protein VFT69_06175 [Pseudolabrys sp.]|jgi:hypothetical protein|nr:hypothetical protein [Pseudolabrys sp.]
MDTLAAVLRSIRTENKGRRDHLDVFREFLDHLGRATRRKEMSRAVKPAKDHPRRSPR